MLAAPNAFRQKSDGGHSATPPTASQRSSAAFVLEHRFAERRHADSDAKARPATFQVVAGDADHLTAGVQQWTARVAVVIWASV